jgi:nitrogen fixation-related uncharacterized protein
VSPHHFASPAPLAIVIGAIGLLAVLAWIVWRFGPTLLRVAGFCSLWVAWAGGSQGGYAYCAIFLLLGAFAWGAGTHRYARRRGRWPSALRDNHEPRPSRANRRSSTEHPGLRPRRRRSVPYRSFI